MESNRDDVVIITHLSIVILFVRGFAAIYQVLFEPLHSSWSWSYDKIKISFIILLKVEMVVDNTCLLQVRGSSVLACGI